MSKSISRRDFLKLSGLALGGLALRSSALQSQAFIPVFPRAEEQDQGRLARVTIKEIDLRSAPRDNAPIIGKRYRDQLVHIYAELTPADAPAYYNRLWYRVWGGYLHSAYLQIVNVRLNEPLSAASENGVLAEVTVPYTPAYLYSTQEGWRPRPVAPLYYETTHWITGIETGPDGQPWYKITSEIDNYLSYYVPAIHLRPIPPEEIAPLSPEVPAEKKHIEVSLSQQQLTAYENGQAVFTTRISSGIPSSGPTTNGIPTATPKGTFNIYSKLPSKHMGSVTGNPDALANGGYSLPGVPWTSFFAPRGGVAFHGTYWHNNFGLQMSHGCVNMRIADAKWLFRWTTPVFPAEIKSRKDWERTGNGTRVVIF
ncbi:MAG TPA: L,D-transpeptidase [Anaerolineales bacterium]